MLFKQYSALYELIGHLLLLFHAGNIWLTLLPLIVAPGAVIRNIKTPILNKYLGRK